MCSHTKPFSVSSRTDSSWPPTGGERGGYSERERERDQITILRSLNALREELTDRGRCETKKERDDDKENESGNHEIIKRVHFNNSSMNHC